MKRKLRTIIDEYYYESEEERDEHVKMMESHGWADSGQTYQNVGTVDEPSFLFYSKLIKYSTL